MNDEEVEMMSPAELKHTAETVLESLTGSGVAWHVNVLSLTSRDDFVSVAMFAWLPGNDDGLYKAVAGGGALVDTMDGREVCESRVKGVARKVATEITTAVLDLNGRM